LSWDDGGLEPVGEKDSRPSCVEL